MAFSCTTYSDSFEMMICKHFPLQSAMTPANSDKNLNIYVKTPQTVRANRYGGAVRTDSKKTYLAG